MLFINGKGNPFLGYALGYDNSGRNFPDIPATLLYLIMILAVSIADLSCAGGQGKKTSAKDTIISPTPNTAAGSLLKYSVFQVENGTWGYDILKEGTVYIHQPSIPGLPGNDGFNTKENAEKVAEEVILKISRGEMPPTLTIDDLKRLNVVP